MIRRRRKRVAIIWHEREDPGRTPLYAIHHLAEFWREDGIEVVDLFGAGRFVPADLAIVHVDLSMVPDEYLELARRYPIALNAHVKDIRKTTFSTLRVERGSDYAGRVIVKSNLNYAGIPERLLEPGSHDGPVFQASTDYPVFDSVSDVPPQFFGGEFIVERFVPEIDDGRHRVRTHEFLGDRQTSMLLAAEDPVVGHETHIAYELVDPPPRIFELRRRLRLDYGKLDFVVHGSTVTLLDVNKTTGASNPSQAVSQMRRYRAEGIHHYLRR